MSSDNSVIDSEPVSVGIASKIDWKTPDRTIT